MTFLMEKNALFTEKRHTSYTKASDGRALSRTLALVLNIILRVQILVGSFFTVQVIFVILALLATNIRRGYKC